MKSREEDELANALGVDLNVEPNFEYLMKGACSTGSILLPNGWENQSEGTKTVYYHTKLHISRILHPTHKKYLDLVTAMRSVWNTGDGRATRGEVINGLNEGMQLDGEVGNSTDSVHYSHLEMKNNISVLVNEACIRKVSGLDACTPILLKRLSEGLGISITRFPSISIPIKTIIDDFSSHVIKLPRANGGEGIVISSEEVDEFLIEVYRMIIHETIMNDEEDVVVCQECEGVSAKFKCEECKDIFCNRCFKETHITGKRTLHRKVGITQIICSICDLSHAYYQVRIPLVVVNEEDGHGANTTVRIACIRFCETCYNRTVAHIGPYTLMKYGNDTVSEDAVSDLERFRLGGWIPEGDNALPQENTEMGKEKRGPRLSVLPRHVIRGLNCTSCQTHEATILCVKCMDVLCEECSCAQHMRGNRRFHKIVYIDPTTGCLYYGGSMISHDTSRELVDSCLGRISGCKWVPFTDDQLNVYWFDFEKGVSTKISPYKELVF